ncbi:MAG: IS30 family transposase [Desulfovibrionaceae bacterium]|nr:IS30 family transposase [Desulfovibrionaceae bacterium]
MSSGKIYHHISDNERAQICDEFQKGKSARAIAKVLGRAPSTISRELRKGCPDGVCPENRKGYNPLRAKEISRLARKRCGPKPKATPERLSAIKHGIVELRFSPEQIAGSDQFEELGVCVSTMYRWLDDDKLLGQYKKSLRRKGKRLKNGDGRLKTRFADAKGIEERPQGCIDRTEFGHFEVDTVVSVKGKKACLFTAVERKTRHTFVLKSDYCDTVGFDDLLKMLKKKVPEGCIKSITADRGSEFSNWKLMEEKHGIPIYFCNAHHPWEKGTNENTNGLIREFYPKKTDFTNVTQRDLYFNCIRFLHMRPRKVLGFKTSLDLFREECNNLLHLKCFA